MLYYSTFTKRIRHRTSDLMELLTTHSLRIHQGLPMPFIHDFRDLIHGYTSISLPKDVIAIIQEDGLSLPYNHYGPYNKYGVINFISEPFQEYIPMSHLSPGYYDNLVNHINSAMTNVYYGLERQHQYALEVRHRRVIETLKLERLAAQPPASKRRKVDITDVCYYASD